MITNARRPRIRPRSSLTPTAPTPPAVRRKVPNGDRGRRGGAVSGAGSGRGRLATSSIVATPWSTSGRLDREGLIGSDLEEQLLEVARGAGEAGDGQPGSNDGGQQARGSRVVAAEAELHRAVGEDRRRRDIGLDRQAVAGGRQLVALEQEPHAKDGTEAKPSFDLGDTALGQNLAAIDDRHARAQLFELGKDVADDHDGLAHRA